MICVSLGRTRHSAFLEGHRYLAEHKAELVELRVDWLRKRPDIGRLLKDRPTPVVVTCRRKEDRGMWPGDEEQRLAVLREAIIGGADYVDLEVDIAKSVPRYGDTKRIVSYHNFEDTPLELHDIYQSMTQCDPDIIKIVTMANRPSDNVRMLELLKTADVPTVAFCMGEFGTVSRILCGQWGAAFTYAGFSSGREMAPGQLTFAEIRNLYRFNKLTSDTKVFAVIGDPIGHSLSPLLHNAAFRHQNFDGVYVPLKIPAELLADTLQQFEALNISGYSVTIPHKQAVLDWVTAPDARSDRIGAANTLFRKDGEWHTTNTDADAITQTIKNALTTEERPTPNLTGQKVLILGAGGVARAAVVAMQEAGADVVVTNRSPDRAAQLATEFQCRSVEWQNRGGEACEILINATSVGMQPNVDESPFEGGWLQPTTLVFDTVYTPENTLLLKQARQQGCKTASGLEMFVLQAAKQFQIFTGQKPPVDYMVETLRQGLSVA